MVKFILTIIVGLLAGALGAMIFMVFLLPYMLTNPYFEKYAFVANYKQGAIVVDKTEKIYIQENTAIQNSIEKVKPSVVAIQTANALYLGFVATSDGSIITVAAAATPSSKVFLDGQEFGIAVVKKDVANNVALLKIEKNNLQTVAFAGANEVTLAQRVFLIAPSSVKMDNWLVNEGILRQIGQNTIETTMTEKFGLMGGPSFTTNGELIGLNVVDAQGKVSIIPINKIQSLLGL